MAQFAEEQDLISPSLSSTLGIAAVAGVILAFASSASAEDKSKPFETAEGRLKFMQECAAAYTIQPVNRTDLEFVLKPDPVLRWTNPVSGLKDGTLFIWTMPNGRPAIAAQLFLFRDDLWLHEFQSLSEASFDLKSGTTNKWTPRKPGIVWQEMPGAPVPADSPTKRLIQMKAIAERFTATDDFEGTSRWELRLQPRPTLRYSADEEGLVDGAMFSYVHTTDPEVFLLLEATRAGTAAPKWRYALAPMTGFALKVSLDGKDLWEKRWIKSWEDGPDAIRDSYFIFEHKP